MHHVFIVGKCESRCFRLPLTRAVEGGLWPFQDDSRTYAENNEK